MYIQILHTAGAHQFNENLGGWWHWQITIVRPSANRCQALSNSSFSLPPSATWAGGGRL